MPIKLNDIARIISGIKDPARRAEAAAYLGRASDATKVIWKTPEATELENRGWEAWLGTLGPRTFSGKHAPFHREFWDWYWPLLLAKRDGQRLVRLDEPLSYLLTLGRGMGKSVSVEWAVIALGAIVGRALVIYVSSTGKLAVSHLNSIRGEIEGSLITQYYPGMSSREVGKHKNAYGWRGDLLATASELTIFAVGLEEEVRGIKKRDLRPALIVLDDIDSKSDSPDVVKKKEGIIGGSIFGTQTPDTIIMLAQNLIHSNSVATRIWKRRSEILSYRKESGLVGAFTPDFKIDMVGTRWRAVKGKPVWDYFDEEAFQKSLDTMGPIEAAAEYQHRFDLDLEGKVAKNYNDRISVITEEEFAGVYGVRRPPSSWFKYVAHDKARTKTEYHANVALTVTMSSQNTPLPGLVFLYDLLSFEADSQPDDCAIAMLKCISPMVRVDGVEYTWEKLVREIIGRENINLFTGNFQEQIQAQREGLARIIPKHVRPLLTSQSYQLFRMSHEADDWNQVYQMAFGLPYAPANPGATGGSALINLFMKVDETIRDPFKRIEQTPEGPQPLMGMSRLYIIVPKNKLPYPNDAKPDLLHGSDLCRYQFTEQRNLAPRITKSGEEELGPEKRNDDYWNCCQMLFHDNSVRAKELLPGEKSDLMLPAHLQVSEMAKVIDPEQREKDYMAREVALRRQAFAKINDQLQRGSGGTSRTSGYRRMMRKSL